ncbi:Polyketide cyclase / dehydrase and lipid transport (plasmid) [Streptomyces lavendulae subsp. lavendulae]|uniref:Polyketide cyclase/dehydrase n=3 Tax=Streptomycetaceae TaxID=2062 RepID=E1ARN3_KITAU|nr:polyketide cyclase/dehydrase [Streptomyces lavendulae subsp. lavendulae]ATZ29818.1 Polyketide cyclase / dehydrase and lipid transport [Streptomyces lavendulae subsp. lavendulae]
MSVERVHRMSHAVDAAAPAGVLYNVVADTAPWPLFLPDTVHVERLDSTGTTDRFSQWADTDGRPRPTLWRRTLDAHRRRIDFRRERPADPVTTQGGSWSVEELAPGWSRLTLEQDITVAGNRSADVERVLASARDGARSVLGRLGAVAERWRRLDGLLLSFEDSVRIPGPGEPVHEFLYRVGSWPGRVAHVVGAEVTEVSAGVQRTSMVNLADDGSAYTTEEVRVCFPAAGRIVFKRTRPHPLLAAHAGEWSVEPDATGVTVVCRHDVLLDAGAVERMLGPGADPARAGRHVREVLGRESRATLEPAQQYARESVRSLRPV